MNSILFIGTGGCGNKLVDEFASVLNNSIGLTNVYDYKFINSNENEMSTLTNYNAVLNGIIINGGGTGRNQAEAKRSLKLDKSKVVNIFSSILHKYTTVYLVSSADGGFGSGSIDILAKVIRSISSNIKINLLAAMPKINSKKLGLENAIRFYEDVIDLSEKGIINSIQFIDNDVMHNEEKFNSQVVESVLDSLEFSSGVLDSSDSNLINSADGYKVVLPIRATKGTLSGAIEQAIKESPFVIPDNLDCTHLGGVFVKKEYDKDEVLNLFDIRDIDKTAYGDSNIVVLGGCEMPDDHIRILQQSLDDLNRSFSNRSRSNFKSNLGRSYTTSDREDTRPTGRVQVNRTGNTNNTEQSQRDKLRALLSDDLWN